MLLLLLLPVVVVVSPPGAGLATVTGTVACGCAGGGRRVEATAA
jgi:hypothetical protein